MCLGFLPCNFHPAKIIMGDCGALVARPADGGVDDRRRRLDRHASFSGQSFFFFAPLFIPLVILGVPILDTAFAIVRRATRRSGLATADKEHLHHRLMRLGHGQRRSVLILWTWTALLSGLVLYPTFTGRGDAVVPDRHRRARPAALHGVPSRALARPATTATTSATTTTGRRDGPRATRPTADPCAAAEAHH